MDASVNHSINTYILHWSNGYVNTIKCKKLRDAISISLICDDNLYGITVLLDSYEVNNITHHFNKDVEHP